MSKHWDDFTDFEDIECYKDGFPIIGDSWLKEPEVFKDQLHLLCEQFILEHDLPDDTDPASLRLRVWRAIGFYNRIKLMFRGIRP